MCCDPSKQGEERCRVQGAKPGEQIRAVEVVVIDADQDDFAALSGGEPTRQNVEPAGFDAGERSRYGAGR
jgi:hypothetical protein